MTNREKILELLASSARPLTDTEIRQRTGIEPHQAVNQICRGLAAEGVTDRRKGPDGYLVNSVIDRSLIEPRAGQSDRSGPDDGVSSVSINLEDTLFVIPCSGRKCDVWERSEEAHGQDSVIDWLPDNLASELVQARRGNALKSQLDESRTVPANRRYTGMLYESANGVFERLEEVGAQVAIVSGGYGVVLGSEPIGWYKAQFDERDWPNGLVSRCLAAYAESIGATSVVGLFAETTDYAKAFRKVGWPDCVGAAWLISPVSTGGGAMVKVPRAIGEALAEIAEDGVLPEHWASSDGVLMLVHSIPTGSNKDGRTAQESLVSRTQVQPSREVVSDRVGFTLGSDEVAKLKSVRARFIERLAGTDKALRVELDERINLQVFASYLMRVALDGPDGG